MVHTSHTWPTLDNTNICAQTSDNWSISQKVVCYYWSWEKMLSKIDEKLGVYVVWGERSSKNAIKTCFQLSLRRFRKPKDVSEWYFFPTVILSFCLTHLLDEKLALNFKISLKNKSLALNSPIPEHFIGVCNTFDSTLFEELSMSTVGCDFWVPTCSAYLHRWKQNKMIFVMCICLFYIEENVGYIFQSDTSFTTRKIEIEFQNFARK